MRLVEVSNPSERCHLVCFSGTKMLLHNFHYELDDRSWC
jgi:hypothetical protein